MAKSAKKTVEVEPPAPGSVMTARLALLGDDEIDRLRSRIMQLMRMGTPEQRQTSANQLEAIDVERERRLSLPPVQK
jgi:hypothetical protein